MYLSELRLWNFRKFGSANSFDIEKPNLELPFQKGLNLLVGENDSGKTAIVDAIKYVLLTNSREYIRLDVDDFYFDSTTDISANKLRIECNFKFNSSDGDSKSKNFLDWAHFNDSKEYELRVFLEAELKNGKIEPYDIRGGIDNEGVVLDARARELLRVTYLKPLRDAKEELRPKKGSRLSQVLDSHPVFAVKNNHFLSQTVKFANNEIDSFFKGKTPHHVNLYESIKAILGGDKSLESALEAIFEEHIKPSQVKGDEIADKINTYLGSFFGTKKLSQFQISETSLRGILERLSLQLESTNAGLGSQNLLFIAVELLLLEREADFTGLRLALIEEIEAHLHPQAQMRLVEYLQERCNSENIQMLLTTHSPNLASKIKLKNLIICQDSYAFPMGSDYTLLDEEDYAFLERFLDVTKANLFFAKGVILVEGDAENLLLPTIAKIIDCDLTQHGVSVVNLGNVAFSRYENIFLRRKGKEMEIPVAVVTDLDQKPNQYYVDNPGKMPKNYQIDVAVIQRFKTANPLCIFNDDDLIGEYKNIGEIEDKIRDVIPHGSKGDAKTFFNLSNENWTLVDVDISVLSDRKKKILISKKGRSQKNVQYCVAENWTLEYEIALSCLKELFYDAICLTQKIGWFDENALATLNKFSTDYSGTKDKEEIAYDMYWKKMMKKGESEKNKGFSKAIVAQLFAEILEREIKNNAIRKDELKTQINADPYLKYLVDAIKHATKKV